LQTKGGCDSVLIYNVRISNSGKDSLTQTICSGQCFTFPSGKKVCQTGIFRDTVRESTGCLKETVVNLKIIDAFTTPNNVTICKGQTYTLPRGRVVSTEGVYRDTLKASGGCDSVILTTLKISDPPQATISGFGTNESPEGTPLTLNTPSVDGGKYEWFLDSVKTTNTQNNINLTLKAGQNFIKVLVTNMFGCKNEATATLFGIPELNIPNAFSPNGDNLNDYFNIVSKLENYYTIQKFQIYNRLGKKIYDNNNGSRGWDGRCNGDDCISDVYIYIIEVTSKSGKILKFNGEINLIR
jgi:gliding motility-associated-like protein